MGRAQVVQAQAARARLSVDMNPVLLKPSTDMKAQVIGTIQLLDPDERERAKGIVINRFRGDPGFLMTASRSSRRRLEFQCLD
jgi:cobyric acid synthase